MPTTATHRRAAPLPIGLALLFAMLAVYAMASAPGLAGRWGASPLGGVLLLGWGVVVGMGGWALLQKAPEARLVILIGAGILTTRIAMAALMDGHAPTGDAGTYPMIARHLLSGQGLFVDDAVMATRVWAFYPPLYPLLLSGWGAIAGLSTWSLTGLNLGIDGAAALVIARLGDRLGARGAGRVAAFAYLLWPSLLFSAPLAQKEGLATLLILLIADAWVARVGAWRLGLAAGLLALTQPGQVPLAALFGVALIGRIGVRGVARFGLAAVPVTLAVMAPWWLRNALVLGQFVPLTSAGGISLWIGNHADATGNWMPPPPELRGLSELAYSRRTGAMAMAWITAHPAEFAWLTLTKFVRAAGTAQFGVLRLALAMPPVAAAWLAALLPLAQGAHALMLGAGAAALVLARRPAVATLALLIGAGVVQLALFGVWFEFGERHREFLTPFVLLLTAGATSSSSQPRSS